MGLFILNNGEAGIRTLGPSFPSQLLSRKLQSATLAPLPKNFPILNNPFP
jgi:hypothetical protein